MTPYRDGRPSVLTAEEYARVAAVIQAALQDLGVGHLSVGTLLKPYALLDASARPPRGRIDVSPRESEVLELLLDGCGTGEIAAALTISLHTARQHVKHLLMKFGVRHRAALVARAMYLRMHASDATYDVRNTATG